jgi:hypothetical protein
LKVKKKVGRAMRPHFIDRKAGRAEGLKRSRFGGILVMDSISTIMLISKHKIDFSQMLFYYSRNN